MDHIWVHSEIRTVEQSLSPWSKVWTLENPLIMMLEPDMCSIEHPIMRNECFEPSLFPNLLESLTIRHYLEDIIICANSIQNGVLLLDFYWIIETSLLDTRTTPFCCILHISTSSPCQSLSAPRVGSSSPPLGSSSCPGATSELPSGVISHMACWKHGHGWQWWENHP